MPQAQSLRDENYERIERIRQRAPEKVFSFANSIQWFALLWDSWVFSDFQVCFILGTHIVFEVLAHKVYEVNYVIQLFQETEGTNFDAVLEKT